MAALTTLRFALQLSPIALLSLLQLLALLGFFAAAAFGFLLPRRQTDDLSL